VTLYILCRESLMKHTGRCQNDFNAQGYVCPPRLVHWVPGPVPREPPLVHPYLQVHVREVLVGA
jgi:hypothetical protein